MATVAQTAYPTLPANFSLKLLNKQYQPTNYELEWLSAIRKPIQRLGFLVQLKTLQRLGYVVSPLDCPDTLIKYLAKLTGITTLPSAKDWAAYIKSTARTKHLAQIREFVGVKLLQEADWAWLKTVARRAALVKDAVNDILNVSLEELIHHRFELPGFTRLLRLARTARNEVNTEYYRAIYDELRPESIAELDQLLIKDVNESYSAWQRLKREPKKPSAREIRSYIQHVTWLKSLSEQMPQIRLPATKLSQFMLEARALDAKDMRELKPLKRYALAVLLIRGQHGKALDDVADIMIRILRGLESVAKKNYDQHILNRQKESEALVRGYFDAMAAFGSEGTAEERIDAIQKTFSPDLTTQMAKCQEYLAAVAHGFLPFMLQPYHQKRSLLFLCLEAMELRSTSTDQSTISLIANLQSLRNSHKEMLPVSQLQSDEFDLLTLLSPQWQNIIRRDVAGNALYHRKLYELACFSMIRRELQSGDLHVVHAREYDDYREDLVSWEEYQQEIDRYAQEVEQPVNDAERFVTELQLELSELATTVDLTFPGNSHAQFIDGRLSLKKSNTARPVAAVQRLDTAIVDGMEPSSIVDILTDCEHWLELHKLIHTAAGNQVKIEFPEQRFLTTLFCYGCNLGPAQTSRSVKGFTQKQVAWLNLRHVTEERLEKALTKVVNAYNQFDLPKYWGSGKHASADGTKWELYEQNLMSEFHIRYGGYGGIGYYHVSDTYIALFSHFIPCGTYEGVHILDIVQKNDSDIQPDTLHGDTQSQSYTVFGLAHLLGIKLMPRIRNIQDLSLYRPSKDTKYQHIDALFKGSIDFDLIQARLPDMLRVVVSIKLGRITPSTLLKRLGTFSRKNKLYFAFRELGRLIRTMFLLNYIDNHELRQLIHAETNKSEAFNDFTKWLFFGNDGIIAENIRHEQQKIVKYNQLVANMVILYNTEKMTKLLKKLAEAGHEVTPETLAGLSPYRTSHINRYGDYHIDINRKTEPLDFTVKVIE
jgi:TnpA family transposase